MPYAQSQGASLYYEETGAGHPIVFSHEFAADCRAWETQVRWFSRQYRCITYNARGYPPSEVPDGSGGYGYEQQVEDLAALLRHLDIPRAHIVGLSMGAYATLLFGLRHPVMATALVVAGCGSGAPSQERAQFKADAEAAADRLSAEGMGPVARDLAVGPTRVQFQNKDPRGWAEFAQHLAEHSAKGSALTLRNYQAVRPSLYDFEAELRKFTVPTLLAVGDEDDPCLDVNLFLKRCIPASGLWVAPRTGHAVNLEEPAAFNQAVQEFFGMVERGRWTLRDPRSTGGRALAVGRRA
jgi:pimeloyl-ACP methyl ester carboxylesterase